MTETPQRPDALSPQYDAGSTSPDPFAPVPAITPDPSADRYSAFDEPFTPRRPSGRRPRTSATVRRSASGSRRLTVGIIGVVTVLLLGLVGLVASRSSDSGSSSSSDSRDEATLPVTPVSVAPSQVPSVPQRPTSLRVEFHGTGRVVDLRLYSGAHRTTRLTGVTLPYAVDLAVDPDDAYFAFSADDYGYRGTEPMSCSVTTGGVELSRSVGTQTVDCKVTDGSWRNTR